MALRHLLVLRALGLGDLLTGVPALRGLRAAFPRHPLVLAAPSELAPLALSIGAVDEVLPVGPLERLPALAERPAVAANLHGRGPESHGILLAARPGRLIAFHHPDVPASDGLPRWRADEHEVDRWCRLLRESGIDSEPQRLRIQPPRGVEPPVAPGATVVHPGASSPARRWPPERWAAVARAEASRGRRVVVTGSAAERGIARSVAARAGLPGDCVLAGLTSLLDLAALVASAGRVLSGDTGIAHLALALGTPSITLFGPISPELWGPRLDPLRHRALWTGIASAASGDRVSPGLLELDVADVLAAIAELDALAGAAPGRPGPRSRRRMVSTRLPAGTR